MKSNLSEKKNPYLRFARGLDGWAPVLLAMIAILASSLLLTRLGLPEKETLTLDRLLNVPARDLSQKDLEYYVRVLSSYHMQGRESGRESGKKATEFLLNQYQGSGLSGYFDGSFNQPFSFNAGIQSIDTTISFSASSGENLPSEEAKAITVPAVPVAYAKPSSVEGDMVFGGFCVSDPKKGFDELARINVAGKIVLCLRYGPGGRHGPYREAISFRAKYNVLKQRGASGIVFLGHPGTPPVYAEFFGGSEKDGPPSVIVNPEPFYERIDWLAEHDAELREKEGEYSPHLGQSLGQVSVKLSYEKEKLTGQNVAASIKGSFEDGKGKNRKWIIVGAHYDHLGNGTFGSLEGAGEIHNGADDNASGTAAVLELAMSLRKMYEQDPSIIPEPYDVVFMHFDAEERGLYGSEYFVDSSSFSAEDSVVMLNLDMVGMLREGKGLQFQGAQTADESWKGMIQSAFDATKFAKDMDLRFFPGGNGPSDHSPFYRKNVPVGFFFTGEHSHYHKSTDDFHRLNYPGLYDITFMARVLILELASAKQPIVFQQAPEVQRSDLEFDVRLGIIPGGYGETEGGLLVSGVKEDTPVAATGIQKGDRIIHLGGQDIQNIQDLTEFLYGARLNTEYEIRFKRGDKIFRARTQLIPGGAH
ncbi:MAG: hypothetical protein CMF59_08010 [Leptospiraceae bacterium]|nr:hypothetical protein [Leptospiraceae bacterium]